MIPWIGILMWIIPDAGHLIPMEQPARFNEAIDAFLSSF